jgi:hypothetical protein
VQPGVDNPKMNIAEIEHSLNASLYLDLDGAMVWLNTFRKWTH